MKVINGYMKPLTAYPMHVTASGIINGKAVILFFNFMRQILL
jgi:hypothetical protein